MSLEKITTRTDNNGKNNEDSFFVGENGDKTVLCVCDGVGGTDAGEIASGYVVKSFEIWLESHDLTSMSLSELHREISCFAADMHDDLWTHACNKRQSLATTMIIAVIGEKAAVFETIGDSRAYICQRRYLKQVTIDQTVKYYEMVTGDILPEYVNASEKRKNSILMQCIGGDPEGLEKPRTPVPVRYTVAIDEAVDIILCSDGLSNKLNELNFQSELLRKQTGDKVLDNLIALAKKRGERDNITAILYRRRKA